MAVLQTLLTLAYPPLIYFGLTVMAPWQVALCVGGILVLRLLVVAPHRLAAYTRTFWLPVFVVASLAVATGASNHPFSLLLMPVAINLGLLGVFASSFLQSETTVERLAKIQVPNLPERELAYCRRVTMLWCGFFTLNGSAALGLALMGDLKLWALYAGGISYVLMGALFAGEYLYRHWRFRRFVGAPLDPVLKWMFPPKNSDETFARLEPEELGEHRRLGSICQDLRVPEDLSVWPGHFPEYFIVPGVLQIRWVLSRVRLLTDSSREIQSLESLKFKRPLLPGQKFRLKVEVSDRDPNRFLFVIADGDDVFSKGVICLRTEGPQ